MLLGSQIAPRTSGLVATVTGAGTQGSKGDDEPFTSQVCIANIGPRQRHQRLMFGVYTFLIALVALALMLVFRLDVWWRLLLFVPFVLATSGYFQARDHT